MTLPENIRKVRTTLGLTQSEFAAKVGASQSAVNFWENGKRMPRLEQIRKIATAFDMSMAEIIGESWGSFSPEDFQQDWDSDTFIASFEERTLIQKYRSLDPYGQETISLMMDREVERTKQAQQAVADFS